MIRSQLCAIGDISPSTFNSHRRNGDLPFGGPGANPIVKGGWGRFSLHDAMFLIAARQLAATQGVGWGEAASILRSNPMHVGRGPVFSNYWSNPGHYMARVSFVDDANGFPPSWICTALEVYAGPLADIVATATEKAEWASERSVAAGYRPVMTSTFAAVNLSHMWELTLQRAAALGISPDATTLETEPDE